ncbi:ESX secretion-associated protein EspG [Actinokineospora iranica]|uniref:EspG family protein n=1 Tax=Actinokineospora iranica TaxID=1271860 RepID=A0A1G6XZ16_9PSEU|nr:ESX secretion-associated protein EspG [Actinokineospora iranica]SDD82923.1 EspG family protein [Actinokineospora iranica]
MSVRAAETLSPLALDFLWEALGAGDLPYPLEVRSHGATVDERALLRRRVHEELRERGLLDRTGRVEAHIERSLALIARPEIAIDSVFLPEVGGPAVAAFAAVAGGDGVLAVQAGGGLLLTPIRAEALVTEVVGMLPGAPRGSETSISLPAAEFAAGGRGNGVAAEDTKKALARLVSSPNLRGGQIAVTSRDRMGGRKRGRVLSWFDKPSGRYLSTMRRGRDGQDWVTVAPADAPTFRHRVAELVSEVTAPAR